MSQILFIEDDDMLRKWLSLKHEVLVRHTGQDLCNYLITHREIGGI